MRTYSENTTPSGLSAPRNSVNEDGGLEKSISPKEDLENKMPVTKKALGRDYDDEFDENDELEEPVEDDIVDDEESLDPDSEFSDEDSDEFEDIKSNLDRERNIEEDPSNPYVYGIPDKLEELPEEPEDDYEYEDIYADGDKRSYQSSRSKKAGDKCVKCKCEPCECEKSESDDDGEMCYQSDWHNEEGGREGKPGSGVVLTSDRTKGRYKCPKCDQALVDCRCENSFNSAARILKEFDYIFDPLLSRPSDSDYDLVRETIGLAGGERWVDRTNVARELARSELGRKVIDSVRGPHNKVNPFGQRQRDLGEKADRGREYNKMLKDIKRKNSNVIQVRFKSGDNKPDDQWIVYANKKPIFRVKAANAFKDLKAKPEGTSYSNNHQAFTSLEYGKALKAKVEQVGWQKVALMTNADVIVKRAQQPQVGEIPNGPDQPGGVSQQATPNNLQNSDLTAGGMNPDAETLQNYDSGAEESKPPVTKALQGVLAVLIASGAYSLEEVMQQLQQDLGAADGAESFKGALSEEVDNLKEDASAEDVAEPDMGMPADQGLPTDPTAEAPQTGNVQEMAQQLKGAMRRLETKDRALKKATEIIKLLSKSANTQVRVKTAQELVDEMQFRLDATGEPLIPTVDYLVDQGVSRGDAEARVAEVRKEEISKIAKLNDSEFEEKRKLISKFPKQSQVVSRNDRVPETHPLLYLASEGIDRTNKFGLDDELFKAKPLAEKYAEERSNGRRKVVI